MNFVFYPSNSVNRHTLGPVIADGLNRGFTVLNYCVTLTTRQYVVVCRAGQDNTMTSCGCIWVVL